MRITQQMSTAATLAGLQYTAGRQDALQAQLSSGQLITKPSDNPGGTVTALELRKQVNQSTQFQTNANAATTWLTQVDTNMSAVNAQLQKARTLVVQGLNSGAADASSRNAIADQIDGINKSLQSLANSTFLGRPVFGGTTGGSSSFAIGTPGATSPGGTTIGASGVYYTGDQGAIMRDVGPNSSVQVNQTGTSVFGADGNNVFDLLTNISSQLRSGTLPGGQLTALDAARQNTSTQQSQAGAVLNQVQVAQNNVTNNVLQYKTQLSTLQDIDVADMAISVNAANMSYQASLATTAKIASTSLLDFLR